MDYEYFPYESILLNHPDETVEGVADFLRGKDIDPEEAFQGERDDISETTLEHLMEDVEEGRDDRKRWFRIKAARAMLNYEANDKWSSLEMKMRSILESMNLELEEDYWHNFKLHNEDQSGYFAIDFLFPDYRLVAEVDGSIWHEGLGEPVKDKDDRRDAWLKKLGFEIIRFDEKRVNDTEFVKEKIKEVIE